ncbi:glycoside hydrolase family 3 N-terminal domain-containing protein [Sinomonas flava]|uniref:glycoside hydrolase family 3 N-terminal domain-containing protein n=1 Tax=Sinomonas flava TaxID=496857 RepID=UPI0039A4797F
MAHPRTRTWIVAAAGIIVGLALASAVLVRLLAPEPGPTTPPAASASGSPEASAGGGGETTPPASTEAGGSPAPSSAPSASQAPAPSRAQQILASMTLEQRVGQVVMVGTPVTGADAASLDALRRLHIGNVFLKGRTTAGAAAVSAVVAALKAEATPDATLGVGQFIATDQEGGNVQILRGPGFSDIPAAIDQGAMDPAALRAAARTWGRELAASGVNVNLAPVLDTVPSAEFAPSNAPIGKWGREYGYSPEAVASHGVAFAQGMADAGVATAPKHFPGLGRVTANTDVSAGVADPVTGRNDPYLAPFSAAVRAGAPWAMISNARYPAIDAVNDAVFSPTVIQGMLRGDLGFRGIVVSDDICDAAQLASVPPEGRGSGFLAAGGTVALCTNQNLAPRVWAGIVERAKTDPAFARTVDAAALAVLTAKESAGLLPRG